MNMRALALSILSCALASAQQRDSIPPGSRGGGGPAGGSGGENRAVGGSMGGSFMGNGSSSFSSPMRNSNGGLHMPVRPGGAPHVTKISYFRNTQHTLRPIIFPPAFDRCTVFPDEVFWGRRDIAAEIQWLSRAGFLPVTPVDPAAETLVDFTWRPSGWKAYGFAIPAGGRLQVEVQHTKLGWFRLMAVNKWGQPGPGMLQAAIAHRPIMVTVTNPSAKADAVYIIVDDPAWWSDKEDPYTLVIRRDWDPASVNLSSVKMAAGLWGASPSVSAQFRRPSLTGPAVFPR
jgi:hypothetical protein